MVIRAFVNFLPPNKVEEGNPFSLDPTGFICYDFKRYFWGGN
jgi:hypothetical protein